MKKRMTNIYFWTGIIAVLITALGVNPVELTSWDSLGQLFIDLGKNPFLIGTAIWALVTVYIDPSTGGFKDAEPEVIFTKEEEHE